jgi:hypothetical protein
VDRFASRSGVLLLIVGLGFITELPSHSQSGAADEKTFILLQHDWVEARKKSDMAILENFYATEFTVGNMNGSESSRAADLAMYSSGDMKPALITDGDLKVAIYGQAAMVTGIEHVEGTYSQRMECFRDGRLFIVFPQRDTYRRCVREKLS